MHRLKLHIAGAVLILLAMLINAFSPTAFAEALLDDFMDELRTETTKTDFAMLKFSCRLPLTEWAGVRRVSRRRRGKDAADSEPPAGWQAKPGENWITLLPAAKVPASAAVAVPESGVYRVWLRRFADVGGVHPVTLDISGSTEASHVFGRKAFTSAPAKQQEQEAPIRFEEDTIRELYPNRPTWVWEFVDLELKQGAATFALSATNLQTKISMLFLTRSKSFVPNLGGSQTNNLGRVYYRLRVTEQKPKRKNYAVDGLRMTYHWRFRADPSIDALWYSSLNKLSYKSNPVPVTGTDGKSTIPVGAWTDWVDASWSGTGAGPWATAFPGFSDIKAGTAEIELAWYPAEAGIVRKIATGICNNQATFIVPLSREVVEPLAPDTDSGRPVWGIFAPEYLELFEAPEDIHQRHLNWSREALTQLGLKHEPGAGRAFRFTTTCNVQQNFMEPAARMLTTLGSNAIDGLAPEICEKLGIEPQLRLAFSAWGFLSETHDPADPAAAAIIRKNLLETAERLESKSNHTREHVKEVKLGDEIGQIASAAKINAAPDCRRKFHDYLRSVLVRENADAASFFGVEDIVELECLDELPAAPGLFERRLYYHSQLFMFLLGADYYRQVTEAVNEIFPNAKTYINYSPHPILLGSQTMNHSEWFILSRAGAVSMAWGEDWASRGGTWGYHGIEVVSYYAAWVDCAARQHADPAGFYNVASQGAADHKTFSLASRNVRNIRLYTYGPRYTGAEYSNFWSDTKTVYPEIAKGTHLLAAADDILSTAKPVARRVALLYNRPDEIMNGGTFFVQMDRALTFTALSFAHEQADIILVEDLVPEVLNNYQVLYLNGANLPRAALGNIRTWVEAGGTLVAVAGSGRFDEYGSPLSDISELAGAESVFTDKSSGRFHPVFLHQHQPIGRLKVSETEFTPALETDVRGCRFVLKPSTATPVAHYDDGTCAGTLRQVGNGHVLLWGIQPGVLFKGDTEGTSSYRLELLPLLAKPVLRRVGAPAVSGTAPQMELTRFETENGIAVLLNNFAFRHWNAELPPLRLRVRTAREPVSVNSALKGQLNWRRDGDTLEIEMPVPATVDTVIIR